MDQPVQLVGGKIDTNYFVNYGHISVPTGEQFSGSRSSSPGLQDLQGSPVKGVLNEGALGSTEAPESIT